MVIRLLLYLFWNLLYAPQRRPRDLGLWLVRIDRTRWPWRRFQPGVYHNDDGRLWEVWLADDRSHVKSQVPMLVDLELSMETGEVVGFKVRDETLRRIAEQDLN